MTGDNRLTARFGADTSDFQNGIRAINREMKLVETEFRMTASSLSDWANDATGLEARMKSLNKQIELQGEKTRALKVRSEELAKAHGENSIEAQNAGIEFNKEAIKLNNLQKELGQTQSSLKGLKSESSGVRGAFQGMGKQFDLLKQQVPALGTVMSLLTNPITLAIAGIGAFAAVTHKSIGETVAYNAKVREMMQITGLSAEETSRLIQVADDLGINIESATAAMDAMNKKGVSPSIENLAIIADRFVNSKDKAAFAEEAIKLYGKSFETLVPILVKGGDALKEQAASIAENMLATDKSIAAARRYEIAVDNLGDAWQGFKYTVGSAAIPPLTDTLNLVNAVSIGLAAEKDILERFNDAVSKGLIPQERYNQLRDLANASDEDAITLLGLLQTELENTAGTAENLAVKTLELADADRIAMGLTGQWAAWLRDKENKALVESAKDAENVRLAQEKYSQAMSDLSFLMSGRLTDSNKNFADQQKTITDRMADIRIQIGLLNLNKMLTPEQFEELQTLQGEYDDLAGKYNDNATEHEKATRRILIDLLTQEAAERGLTNSDVWIDLAYKWGLISEAEATAKKNKEAAVDYSVKHPEDLVGIELILKGVNGVWLDILTNMGYVIKSVEDFEKAMMDLEKLHPRINVDVIYNEGQLPPTGKLPPIARAQGGIDYVTKPTLFLAGEAGNETVITIPSSEQLAGNQGQVKIGGMGPGAGEVNFYLGGINITVPDGNPITIASAAQAGVMEAARRIGLI